jgi:hypothetical protein
MSNPSGHNPGQPPGGYPPPGYGPPGHGPPGHSGPPAPGYGHGPPPQQPYGQSPQHGMPTPGPSRAAEPPRRKPRSKALPIVVSTGLAVGVFAGLMIIRGTGEEGQGDKDTAATLPLADAGVAPPDAAPPDAGPPPDAASPPDAGPPTATLTFTIEPPVAELDGFSLEVDGQPVEGTSHTVTLPFDARNQRVQIVAKASGYYSKRLRETIEPDGEKAVEIKLYKRKSGGDDSGGTSSGGPGGIIDL